ncbi:peptidyl-prolyl cis-trans isomerase [Thermosipho atlanticus]|uniref:SurA N-terminal domain-containing protein n=1 Tax=Thermosipho atlanticus DSM 15807 TaxID=1123380 RepID=A0A1M5RV92_9BACT|nr:peptidyl-prolyl cis-trans isomerase [Thermosipho atlanticus]SHH29948.1 SurA N-terminal domain-containing protein [Thermosipho atlanticus DSM 15807]
MKKLLVLMVVLISALLVFGEEATSTTLPGTTVVAIVNGEEVTLDLLNSQANINGLLVKISEVDQTFFNVLTNTDEGVKLLMRYKRAVLDQIVDKLLIVQFAEKYGVRPTDEEVKQFVDKQISDYLSSQGIDEDTFNMYLQYANMGTLKEFKEKLFFDTLVNMSIKNLFDYASQDATVTDDEIKAYYNENIDKYSTPTQFDLYVLTFTNETQAKMAKDKVASGIDFQTVANEFNLGDFKFENIAKGQAFPDKLWEYIENAMVGAILGPINVDGTFYIVKILEKIPPQVKEFEQVKEEIANELLSNKKSEVWSKFIDEEFAKFKKESQVKILYTTE